MMDNIKGKKSKPTILFMEWQTKGREFDIVFPLMYFFEKYLNWHVEFKCQFDMPSILKVKPDLIIVSGIVGAVEMVNWSKLIKRSGIPLYCHFTEGLFREKDLSEFMFGWNESKETFARKEILWNHGAYQLIKNNMPRFSSRYAVSGAIGIDKLKLLNSCADKQKHKVVGIAALGFEYMEKHTELCYKDTDTHETYKALLDHSRNILEETIEANPDITFMIKPHPCGSATGMPPSEVAGVIGKPNVVILSHLEDIYESIAQCSLWVSLQSTTAIQAWLVGVPTISIFPNWDNEKHVESDYPGVTGSLRANNVEELTFVINNYFKNNKSVEFESMKDMRKKQVSNWFGFDDGLNHVRFSSFLKDDIEAIEQSDDRGNKWTVPLKTRLKGYLRYAMYRIAKGRYTWPYFKKRAHVLEAFDIKEYHQFKKEYYPDIDQFYLKNADKIEELYESYSRGFD